VTYRAGVLDRAYEVAGRIADVDPRASAMARLALVSDSVEGRCVLARFLRSGPWQSALPALAVLEPDAVRAVGADLVAAANPTTAVLVRLKPYQRASRTGVEQQKRG